MFATIFLGLNTSCITDYFFEEVSESQSLVVQGFVSNVSYNDLDSIEVDARYFEVVLSWPSDVTNVRDELVTSAEVEVIDDLNEHWDYVEVETGVYRLYYEDFSAKEERSYNIRITLPDGKVYESELQEVILDNLYEDISMEEMQVETYEIYLGEETIRTLKGLNLYMSLLDNQYGNDLYLKWDFDPTYVYLAYLNPNRSLDVNYKCWVTHPFYYTHFVVSWISEYSTSNELLFFDLGKIETHDGLSLLIRQESGNIDFYNYWNGVKQQEEQSELFASPPYNLKSNTSPVSHIGSVYGYFGVVNEVFYRWYFDKDILSYYLEHPPIEHYCSGMTPPQSCYNCTLLDFVYRQTVTNTEPIWWNDDEL